MKNKDEKIIYIGKAKNLKNRVNQYFVSSKSHSVKARAMVSNIDKIEYIVTNSESDALNLECSLIKKHRPKYNILLKDDKNYPYIKITREDYPRVLFANRIENDNAKYFGPYVSKYGVSNMIEALHKMFMLRECKGQIKPDKTKKPCLNFYINKCMAPCIENVSKEEYNERIKDVYSVLGGNVGEILSELEKQMNESAEKMEFENAAIFRDKINNIKKLLDKQVVVSQGKTDEDVVCVYKDDGKVCVQMLYIRDGNLADKRAFFVNAKTDDEDEEIIYAFLLQYYSEFSVPKKIYVSHMPKESEELETFLSDKKGSKVTIVLPERGDKYSYIIMAKKNAYEAIRLKEKRYNRKENTEAITQLKNYLGLEAIPERIEAYDISNTAGQETVASMVVFTNGVPDKKEYRKFKIKSDIKSDDYGAMKEVIERRFKRAFDKNDGKFKKLPDLILADGGKGQVSAVKEAVSQSGAKVNVYGIVKDDKHRTRDITDEHKEYNIPRGTKCFRLLVNIQDEMHRIAITYHRTLMAKKNTESQLTEIPGIGKAKHKALMQHFKTISNIRNAKIDELMSVKGISEEIAKNIAVFFENSIDNKK